MAASTVHHKELNASPVDLVVGVLKQPQTTTVSERVSFQDTIWGFELEGGINYNTPIRVTKVAEGSRAEKACIRPGDKLLRINDIDTSTLTIQQAHEIILTSGIHLRLAVTAPEDEEDTFFSYEDPIEEKKRVCAKISPYWSLQWPWVNRKKLMYRESTCIKVPSKYEELHREKYPEQPFHRYTEDFVIPVFEPEEEKDNEDQENTALSKTTPNNDKTSEKVDESTSKMFASQSLAGAQNNAPTENLAINLQDTANDAIKTSIDAQNKSNTLEKTENKERETLKKELNVNNDENILTQLDKQLSEDPSIILKDR